MALSLEDVGLVSVTVSFIVVCINTFLNMGVFKTMFIIASSIMLFALVRDGRLPPQFVNAIKHIGHLFTSNFMEWIVASREGKLENGVSSTNYSPQDDSDNELNSSAYSNHSNKKETGEKDFDCTMETLIGEELVPDEESAQIALQLISEGFVKADAIRAAKECTCLEFAREYLQKSCNMCLEKSPVFEVTSMIMCTHNFCKKCLKGHYESVLKKEDLDLTCPLCHLPDINDDEEIVHCHHSFIQSMLENVLERGAYNELQTRMVRNAI